MRLSFRENEDGSLLFFLSLPFPFTSLLMPKSRTHFGEGEEEGER